MTGFGRTGRLVRHGPLRRPAGPAGRRQGRHLRVLAVRVRGGVGRGLGDRHPRRRLRPRLHLLAPAGGGRRGPRGAADPGGGVARRGVGGQGRAAAGLLRDAAGRPRRPSGTSGAEGSWWAWSWSRIAATKAPFPRAARLVEAVVRIARERGLLLYSGTGNADGVDGRRRAAGAAVRGDGRGAGADRRRAGRRARRGRSRGPGWQARLAEGHAPRRRSSSAGVAATLWAAAPACARHSIGCDSRARPFSCGPRTPGPGAARRAPPARSARRGR